MTETAPAANQAGNPATPITSAERVALNRQLAQMLKGGVIMDVTTPEQARIAEALDLAQQNGFPAWVSVEPKKFEGTFKNVPARDEVAPEINEALIIERYSR